MWYSNTEEHHHWKCAIQIQGSIITGSVLFKYRGAVSLGVFYSDTEEQSAESVLFYFRVEVALEVC